MKLALAVVVALALLGAYIGMRSNEKEEAAETAGWKTFTEPAQGISFKYPERLPTTYIATHEWPPVVQANIAQFLCAVPLKEVNGRQYCIGSETEGAAGSAYTTYTYNTMKDDKMVSFRFVLRYSQCVNYGEPEKIACENECQAFNLDSLVDRMFQTIVIQ